MAKVNLRAYTRDIESMVDRAQLDEAIAHCQHILKTFPKYLETYRLLGKAYLEYKRHKEAADIFTRILTSEPNDFVANVGMSIIHDEAGKRDDAIWHMERAFEAQSANPAIQAELQRLYARRDGVTPPRIRMTRGALAHMYMRGELYPQAISEARSVLKEDGGRIDMQVLLALAFYRSGQKNEAADNANSVLRRYQYCLDANRVMVEILGADRPESVQPYRQRVYELDPYASQVNGTVFQTSDVGDNAVTIDRLNWDGRPIGRTTDWSSSGALTAGGFGQSAPSLPVAAQTFPNEQPDWLKHAGVAESQPIANPAAPVAPPPAPPVVPVSATVSTPVNQPVPTPAPHPVEPAPANSVPTDDSIPDFLRAAGWGQSTGAFDESKSVFSEPEAPAASDAIQQGDLPDWVKAMMPTDTVQPSSSVMTEAQPAQEEELPDWIKNIGTGALTATIQSADQPDWLQDDAETSLPAMTDGQPDWMSGLSGAESQQPIGTAADDNSLDWLSGLEQPKTVSSQPAQSDWLTFDDQAEEAPAHAVNDDFDFLNELTQPASGQTLEPMPTPSQSGGMGQQDIDDSLAWLENLAAKQGATEGLLVKPEDRKDKEPDWVAQAKSAPAEPPAPMPTPSQSGGMGQQDIDDSLAWLENLAAKQGATEGLLVKPEDRKDKEPDWIAQAKSAPAVPPPAPTPTPSQSGGMGQQDIDDSLAWLENLAAKQGATEGLLVKPEDRKDKEPDWVAQAKSTPAEPPAPMPTPKPVAPPAPTPTPSQSGGMGQQDIDDSLAWLENLAAKQGATEGLLVKPEDRKDKEPDWVAQAKSTPAEPPAPMPTPKPVAPLAPTPTPSQSGGMGQQDIDDSLAWLENLAAKQGATEGLLVKPEDRKDKEPDWVAQAKSTSAEPPAPMPAPKPVAPPAPTSMPSQSGGMGQQDIDDSLAWLENLAAKQGATEGLLVKPEDRKDKEPEWVAQAKSTPAEPPAPEPVDDMPAWLSDLDRETESAPVVAEDPTVMWLQSLDKTEPSRPQQSRVEDDLPAWLRGDADVDNAPVAGSNVSKAEAMGQTDWMSNIDEVPEPAPVNANQNVPSWLKGIEDDSPKVTSGTPGDLPAWLRDETGETVAEPRKIKPTRSGDWTAAVEKEPVTPEPPKPKPEVVKVTSQLATPPPVAQKPVVAQDKPKSKSEPVKKVPAKTNELKPATPPAPYREPVTMRGTGMLSMPPVDPILGSARSELSRSNIPGALEIYSKLIKKGRFLDEAIFDLREALYRYPVEVSIWQTLGDAYMRANRLQDALDAYTKAEELLR